MPGLRRRTYLSQIIGGLFAAALLIPGTQADTEPLDIKVGYLAEAIPDPEPLSLVEPVAPDKGLAGVRLAIGE